MKKTLAISFLLFCFFAQAQSPQVTIKGADSLQVKMSQLLVNVKIVGNIAYTTSEMHFFNKSARQMEAELLFPLPEGVSVSRYAIDINGKMREAVPVNKNKGKQVFEAVQHRRVDPGLLEKVEGNNFKTRIYPIPPNGERTVIIGYEQELPNFDKDNLAYQLTSTFAQKLDKFEVNITVLGATSQPSLINDANDAATLESIGEVTWNKSYQTSIKKTNYQPSEKLLIKIPIRQEIPSIVTQTVNDQHYFYANTVVEGNKLLKKNPNTIGLIWDVSLSCKNRDLKKELDLLDNYFKQLKNTEVTLYLLSYNFEKNQTFTISNGEWTALKTQLENTKYDGGTRFSKIKLPTHDEYLFFTDGLSSLSSNELGKINKPVYTVSSLVSSDYAFMNYNSMKTGGNFINLNQLNTAQALDKMLYQNLKFLGIKENYLVTEVYPAIGTPVSGSFSIAGISLKPKNEIILLFGYDDKATIENKIVLDAENQGTTEVNIEKLWAQKKIANLENQYKLNAEEIETMGKKYGIITQNTSLIVLEDINDYIAYDIVPPAELRPEFDRIVKQQRESRLAQQQNNWNNIEDYRYHLQSWWNKDIRYVKTVTKNKSVNFVRPVAARAEEVTEESEAEPVEDNTVFDAGFEEIGKSAGAETIKGDPDTEITVEPVGNGIAEVVEDNNEPDRGFEEISVGGGEKSNTRVSSYENLNREDGEPRANPNSNVVQSLVGRVSDVNVTIRGAASINGINNNQNFITSGTYKWTANDTISEGFDKKVLNITKVKSWSPDRIYLKALATAPAEKRYEVYLELRTTQEKNPSFYFDVANYFYNNGDKQKALLVLSNIADLGLENHQLYKSLTYVLRQWEAYEDALFTANQVAKWREQEPQAHRDLALTLEDNKQYQAAFDELVKALEVNYYGEMKAQYEGVEDIILMDLNRMITEHPNIKTDKIDKKYLNKIPVAIRIILNWNRMDSDIDLHVIEPNGEECYYGHKVTDAGARFSKDFTQGYGPEQYLLRNALKGKYQIKTNFYGESALTENGPTTVMVEIYTMKNGKTERKLQTIQLGTIKEKQNLAEITID